MMKAVIIEDEHSAVLNLEHLLKSIDANIQIVATMDTVTDAIDFFQKEKGYDVVFMDIHLADGNSFEIFKEVKPKSPIIFTTAYDQYAIQAFKVNSIDYLLKPIDDEDLEKAVKKYQSFKPEKDRISVDFEDIKKLLVNPLEREYKKRFTARVGQHLKIINADEVECFYSENKGTYAATLDGRNYLLDTTLESLEEELSPKIFFRVSRKFYVNINYINDIISYTNSRLQIKLNHFKDQEIIVSRERVKDFKLWLE